MSTQGWRALSPRTRSKPGAGLDRVRVDKARHPCVLMDRYALGLHLLPQRGMRAHLRDDVADAPKKKRIVQNRLTDRDAIQTQLPSIAQQPSGMGQGADWHRTIIGGHAAEFRTGHQRRPRTQVSSTERRSNASRPAADNKHLSHFVISTTE